MGGKSWTLTSAPPRRGILFIGSVETKTITKGSVTHSSSTELLVGHALSSKNEQGAPMITIAFIFIRYISGVLLRVAVADTVYWFNRLPTS